MFSACFPTNQQDVTYTVVNSQNKKEKLDLLTNVGGYLLPGEVRGWSARVGRVGREGAALGGRGVQGRGGSREARRGRLYLLPGEAVAVWQRLRSGGWHAGAGRPRELSSVGGCGYLRNCSPSLPSPPSLPHVPTQHAALFYHALTRHASARSCALLTLPLPFLPSHLACPARRWRR